MLTALRVALGVAWATLVASELIAAQQGLGALIQNASSFFQLDIIYVGIICIGFIALAMDLAAARRDAPAGRLAGADRVSMTVHAPRARIVFDRVVGRVPDRRAARCAWSTTSRFDDPRRRVRRRSSAPRAAARRR